MTATILLFVGNGFVSHPLCFLGGSNFCNPYRSIQQTLNKIMGMYVLVCVTELDAWKV